MLWRSCFATAMCVAMGHFVFFAASVALCQRDRDQTVCTGLEEGAIPTFGCKAYTLCRAGKPVEIDCVGQVFNEEKGGCDE